MKSYTISIYLSFLFLICIPIFLSSCVFPSESKKLGDNVEMYNPDKYETYFNSTKISVDQQALSLQAMAAAFKASYIGYNIKKTLPDGPAASGEEIFSLCRPSHQAISGVEFYDLVRICLARLKDTHVKVSTLDMPGYIITGIRSTIWVNNRMYISEVRENLLEKFDQLNPHPSIKLAKIVKVGSEILSIDRMSPRQAIDELKPFVPGSSEKGIELGAIKDLFRRNYRLPLTSHVSIQIRNEDLTETTFDLPWVQLDKTGSMDSKIWMKKRKIPFLQDIDSSDKLISFAGYTSRSPLVALSNRRNFYSNDDEEDEIFSIGIGQIHKKDVCYLSIWSFSLDEGRDSSYPVTEIVEKASKKESSKVSSIEIMKEFLTQCEASKLPLILDVRENEGGNIDLMALILSLIQNPNDSKGVLVSSWANSQGNLAFHSQAQRIWKSTSEDYALLKEIKLDLLHKASAHKQNLTDWLSEMDLGSVQQVFSGPTFVLVSPNCISACDAMVHMFKVNGRGVLIGAPANGAGFGFSRVGRGEARFRDPFNLFEVKIPNLAFSVALKNHVSIKAKTSKMQFGTASLDLVPFIENNPTTPDIPYEISLQDLNNDNSDFVALVYQNLKH